jgi:hypothetical protein
MVLTQNQNLDDEGNTEISGAVTGSFSPSGLKTRGLITMLAIDSSQWYEAPSAPLTGRNNIDIQNPSNSPSDMLWEYDPAAPSTSGFHVPPGSDRSVSVQGSIPIYVRLISGSTTVVVEELA